MGLLDNKIVTGLQLHVKFIQSDTMQMIKIGYSNEQKTDSLCQKPLALCSSLAKIA